MRVEAEMSATKNDERIRRGCKGIFNAKTPLHPFMDCENLKQDTIPASACMVARARGFKQCKVCDNEGK